MPRRHHFSERRLPLRQPPAEQPFSASPRNWNPVRNGWVLLLLNFNYFQMRFVDLQPTDKRIFSMLHCPSFAHLRSRPRLYVIIAGFQKILRCGTQAALGITGTHGRPKVKVESAPAAITSLSAACRCASRPPSNPSVLPPEIGTQSAMTGFSRI